MGDDRRPGHADADPVDQGRRTRARQLLADDRLLHRRATLPAVLDGPGDADESRLVERALPPLALGHLLVAVGVALVARRHVAAMRLQEVTDAGTPGSLVGGVVEVHLVQLSRSLGRETDMRGVGCAGPSVATRRC